MAAPPEAAPVTAAATAAAAAPSAAGDVAKGEQLFKDTCVICHGEDGKGGHGGGAPLDQVTDRALVVQTVTGGRNSMPPFDGALTAEQIRDVAAYVVERLGAGASGQPAR